MKKLWISSSHPLNPALCEVFLISFSHIFFFDREKKQPGRQEPGQEYFHNKQPGRQEPGHEYFHKIAWQTRARPRIFSQNSLADKSQAKNIFTKISWFSAFLYQRDIHIVQYNIFSNSPFYWYSKKWNFFAKVLQKCFDHNTSQAPA